MAGQFELYQDRSGKFRYRLKNGKGVLVAVSGAYATRDDAKSAIKSLRKTAPKADLDDQTKKGATPVA